MTANDIFKTAAALIAERPGDDPDTSHFTVIYLNIILQECLSAENSMRKAEGEATLTSAPLIETLGDNIAYRDALTRTAIPYALAAHYYRESGDGYHETQFRAEYIAAVEECTRVSYGTVTDVYA